MGRVDRSKCNCYGIGSNIYYGNPTWRNCICTSICPHCGQHYCTRKGAHCDTHTTIKYAANGNPNLMSAYDRRTKKEVKIGTRTTNKPQNPKISEGPMTEEQNIHRAPQ